MKKILVLSVLALLSANINAKDLAGSGAQEPMIQQIEKMSKLSGATFTWHQNSASHWRGFNSFFDYAPNVGGTVTTYVTLAFNEFVNLVTVRVENVPMGGTNPDSQNQADIYTRTYTYEFKDGQVIIGNKFYYNLSEDGQQLSAALNAGNSFAQRLIRK